MTSPSVKCFFCHPCAREAPVSLCLSAPFLFLSSSTLVPDLIGDPVKEWIQSIYEDPVSFSSQRQEESKDPGSPIESGMTRRDANSAIHGAMSRAPAGAAAPQSRTLVGGEDCLSAALVLSNAKELSIKNRALGKADSFLRQTQDRREILRFAQDKLGMTKERHPKGRAWAPMVLDPFAETKEPVLSRAKEPRRAGAKPRKVHSTPFHHSVPDKPDDWNDHSCIGRATPRTHKKQREKC